MESRAVVAESDALIAQRFGLAKLEFSAVHLQIRIRPIISVTYPGVKPLNVISIRDLLLFIDFVVFEFTDVVIVKTICFFFILFSEGPILLDSQIYLVCNPEVLTQLFRVMHLVSKLFHPLWTSRLGEHSHVKSSAAHIVLGPCDGLLAAVEISLT